MQVYLNEECLNFSHLFCPRTVMFSLHVMSCSGFSVALPALHNLQLSEAPEAWLVPTSQGTQIWVSPLPSVIFFECVPGSQALGPSERLKLKFFRWISEHVPFFFTMVGHLKFKGLVFMIGDHGHGFLFNPIQKTYHVCMHETDHLIAEDSGDKTNSSFVKPMRPILPLPKHIIQQIVADVEAANFEGAHVLLPSHLAHNLVRDIPVVCELLQHCIVETKAWITHTFIRNPFLPHSSIVPKPGASYIPPRCFRVIQAPVFMIQQHSVHFAHGQVHAVNKAFHNRSQNLQITAGEGRDHGCCRFTGQHPLLEFMTFEFRKFHNHWAQLQKGWVRRPPIEDHVTCLG